MTAAPSALDTFAATYLRLYQLVYGPDLAAAQWMSGQTPPPREDTSERSLGLTNDPTPAITFDTRRLNLRAAAVEAERALRDAMRVLEKVRDQLEDAHVQWPQPVRSF